MPTDTTLTIRCPYCMAGIEFRPMIAYKDGRFVCRDCAHTMRPGVRRRRRRRLRPRRSSLRIPADADQHFWVIAITIPA
jgi:hypothetical protein